MPADYALEMARRNLGVDRRDKPIHQAYTPEWLSPEYRMTPEEAGSWAAAGEKRVDTEQANAQYPHRPEQALNLQAQLESEAPFQNAEGAMDFQFLPPIFDPTHSGRGVDYAPGEGFHNIMLEKLPATKNPELPQSIDAEVLARLLGRGPKVG